MREVESMDENRRKGIWLAVVGFAAWQIFGWLGDLAREGGHPELRVAAKIGEALGGTAWAVAMVWMWRFMRKMKKSPAAAAALNDEHVQHVRLRAFAIGFWALLFTQSVLVVAAPHLPLTAQRGASLSILVGATAVLVAFLRGRAATDDA